MYIQIIQKTQKKIKFNINNFDLDLTEPINFISHKKLAFYKM